MGTNLHRIEIVAAVTMAMIFFGSACKAQHSKDLDGICDYKKVAKEEVDRKFSFYRIDRRERITHSGKYVVVDYPLPPHMAGGTPVIRIEKKSCKVVASHGTQ